MSNEIKAFTEIKSDNELFNNLVKTTTEMMKLEILQAITNKDNPKKFPMLTSVPTDSGLKIVRNPEEKTVGEVVANRFSNKAPEIRNNAMCNIRKLNTFDPVLAKTIKSNEYNVLSGPQIISQIDFQKQFSFLSTEKDFEDFLELRLNPDGTIDKDFSGVRHPIPNLTKPTLKPTKTIKSVQLKLHRVKCVDETGEAWTERLGSDEINMGGITIDDKNVQATIGEFEVYHDFDDSDVKTYDPPKVLATFVNFDLTYPKTFLALISIAEKDSNGFSKFIADLYEAIKKELTSIITGLSKAAGVAIAAKVGEALGSLAGPIGTVLGAIIAAILGEIIVWLSSILKDDVFTPQLTLTCIESKDLVSDSGVLKSPVASLTYYEHNGEYQADVSWEVTY